MVSAGNITNLRSIAPPALDRQPIARPSRHFGYSLRQISPLNPGPAHRVVRSSPTFSIASAKRGHQHPTQTASDEIP